MSRTNAVWFPWWLAVGMVLAVALAVVGCLQNFSDRPNWSPHPAVQPAATSLNNASTWGTNRPYGEADQWSIESTTDGPRLVYHP